METDSGSGAPANGLSRRRSERLTHAIFLLAAIAVPVLGAAMTTDPGGRVAFVGVAEFPLPTLCPSRWFGLQCPTCGVTRSIIALMHGRIAESVAAHRFGWLILALILTQIPYRIDRLARPEARRPHLEQAGFVALAVTAAIVVFNRLVQLAAGR